MKKTKKERIKLLFLFVALVVFAPLAALLTLVRWEKSHYFEFPPHTFYIRHAAFSWEFFFLYLFIILAVTSPFLIKYANSRAKRPRLTKETTSGKLPLFGWLGVVLLFFSWILAWTRLPLFSGLQPHTFFPLWLGYIVTLNGLCFKYTRLCPLSIKSGGTWLLFISSAFFWWLFEYLNRFVQNWTYRNVENFSASEYFIFATLSFSTVLPAVLSTKHFLAAWSSKVSPFHRFLPLPALLWRKTAFLILLISAFALFLMPALPDLLFALVWVAPLTIFLALEALLNVNGFAAEMADGNWSEAILWALAALLCGFFWELWNYGSYARWVYHIPYVFAFKVFEMPILGYAGYLPFGLLCGAVIRQLNAHNDDVTATSSSHD